MLGAAHGALRALLQQKLEGAANGGPPASNGSAADKNGSSARDGSAASHGAEGAGAPPPSTPMAKMLPRVSRLVPTITAEDVGANPIAAAIAQAPAATPWPPPWPRSTTHAHPPRPHRPAGARAGRVQLDGVHRRPAVFALTFVSLRYTVCAKWNNSKMR